jgi:hypothetical protein
MVKFITDDGYDALPFVLIRWKNLRHSNSFSYKFIIT